MVTAPRFVGSVFPRVQPKQVLANALGQNEKQF